jgi:hypothetical protein
MVIAIERPQGDHAEDHPAASATATSHHRVSIPDAALSPPAAQTTVPIMTYGLIAMP